ncbi:FMN-binding negative transcriptional regulator [Microlunatus speluncae]|uniref:FMN-binding negative transcriptional regulator n=1 Tax=Microlunatus speluncae TaxID=2594267 RepID=UPI0012667455|nr:FMN-binding negative transcriptional regulator [Microlunatus speluncae]
MYVPPANQVTDETELRAMVEAASTAWLITAGDDGVPDATLLPISWRGSTVIAHLAIANQHWRRIRPEMPCLLVCAGPDAYISPSWYAAKAEHGRVVPTWNYTAVQLTGTVRVHQDPEWLRRAVTELTETHEGQREQPWAVTDAPDQFVTGQLRGIVGIEITVTSVEGKAKLSQNRSAADRAGVIDGLESGSDRDANAVAAAMRRADLP